ncbi:hypothetical protein FQN54_006496 [Arachnomyces sp. PD_36]|nr:hypothetical protein FQN54_006496 [Arachnomyces sp. PD_36]
MASLRVPTLRTLLRTQSPRLQFQQRRWAQVHDVRYVATHQDPSQRYQDRYKEKLEKKAKEEGHSSVSSLKEAYKEKIQDLRKSASTPLTAEPTTPGSEQPTPSSPFPAAPPPPPQQQPASTAATPNTPANSQTPGIKPLSSYLNLEKIQTLPAKEIEVLWRLRHAKNPNSICACIPLETYQRIAAAAKSHPQFILPLPRPHSNPDPENKDAAPTPEQDQQTAADIHFLQWGFHPPATASTSTSTPQSPSSVNTHTSTVLFTHLASYKLHGAYAPPHTTITHHLDIADSTGLVLMNGNVDPDRGVSIQEAQWLVMCLQRFYDFGGMEGSGRKGELLRMFTRGDSEGFRVEELMDEVERVK